MYQRGEHPPRRYTQIEDRSMERQFRLLPKIIVRLDGEEQQMVSAYDCDMGVVERAVITRTGIAMTPDGKEVQREIARGAVTAEWRDPS